MDKGISMSAKNFALLLIVILNISGGVLLHKYLKEQKEISLSQERRIDHIYDLLGIE